MRRLTGAAIGIALLLLGLGRGIPAGTGKADARVKAAEPSSADSIEIRLPPDLIFETSSGPSGAVVFRHTTHVPLTGNYQCTTCHPQLFRILHPTHRTSHREIEAGRSCGACHDSHKAFGTREQENCLSCHVGVTAVAPATVPASGPPGVVRHGASVAGATSRSAPAPPPAAPAEGATGPKDVAFRRSADSPRVVTFRHATHGGATARCARCHPGLFAMKAGKTPVDKEAMRQGGTCGSCHNGKEAFGVDDSEQCERCHQMEGGTP